MLPSLTRPDHRQLLAGIAVALLLVTGLGLQVNFLVNYPQAILFGDPGAYYVFGQKFQSAIASLFDGASLADAFDAIRGYLFFAGVGLLYAGIDALSPGDIPTFRLVLAAFNLLGMLGAFLLARSVTGRFSAGLTALALAAFYPSFSVQLGRLYPDPVVSALLVWSAYVFVRATTTKAYGLHALSGLLLASALYVRAQIFDYIVLLLVLTAAATAPFWIRSSSGRRVVAAFGAGFVPLFVVFKLGVLGMGGDFRAVEQYGFFAAPQQQRYPYGFWLFLDSDGWIGPYGLEEYPYYLAMQEEARRENDPELLTSRARQYAFTLRYILARPWLSFSQLGNNVYRLLRHPANQYRWDYPFHVALQDRYQSLIVLLGVAGLAWVALARPAFAFAFFMPVAIASLHALSFPEARYNQPIMLILMSAAGVLIVEMATRVRTITARGRARLLSAGGAGIALALLAAALPHPGLAHAFTIVAVLLLVALPFLVVHAIVESDRRRWPLLLLASSCLTVVSIHMARDRLWHQTAMRLDGRYTGFEQNIALAAPAVATLRSASAVWLFLDLHAPDGDVSRLSIEVEGKRFEGSELVATMPRFGTATVSGARNPRGYPQWWALRLPREVIPQRAPALVSLRVRASAPVPIRVFSDHFSGQERFYEGPSFGDARNHSVLKLVHDGDYRIARRLPLESAGTWSRLLTRDGDVVETPVLFRARLVTLSGVEGHLDWRSEPLAPRSDALSFFAYTGRSGTAELVLPDGAVLPFPLGSEESFVIREGSYRLCYRAEAPRNEMAYGGYVLQGPLPAGAPLALSVRFRAGPVETPMFVSLDRGANEGARRALAEGCGLDETASVVNGAATVVDSDSNSYPENVGPWRVADVF